MKDVNARGARSAPVRAAWPALLLFGALFLGLGIHFALAQNLWVDETTQLLGSRLPLGRLFSWLAGGHEVLGVPNDCMPPLSYLVDWTWSHLGVRDELWFRFLHLAITLAGVLLVVGLVARRYGAWAAGVAGAMLALHPQMTNLAVEIRAYPLFFTMTALQLVLFYRIYDRPTVQVGRLAGFTLVSALSAYAHFFGLVSGCAFFGGLLLTRARSRDGLLRIVGSGIVFLILAAGIVPFVLGATTNAANVQFTHPGHLTEFGLYVVRTAGHPAMMIEPVLAALYFVGLLILLAVGAVRAVGWPPALREPMGPEAGVLVALVAGMAAAMLASLVVNGFDALKPSYNAWLFVPRAVLAASAVAPGLRRPSKALAQLAAAAFILALIAIQAVFVRHDDWFIHGPERVVVQELKSRSGATAIVYDGDAWGWLYFPLVYRFGSSFPQYYRDINGALHRPGVNGDPNTPVLSARELDRYNHILLADVELKTYSELRPLERGDQQSLTIGSASASAPAQTGWKRTGTKAYPGMYSVRLTSFDREMQ